MTAGDRFRDWVDSLAKGWNDRLRGWMVSWIVKGMEGVLEDIEPDSIKDTAAIIAKLKANPSTPPEVKALLERFQKGGFHPMIILGVVMAVAMVIQAVQALWTPTNKQMSYAEEKIAQTYRFDAMPIITAWRRDPEKYAWLFGDLKDLGWSDERIEALKFLTQFYPSPGDLVHWQAREVFEPAMVERYGLDAELGEITKDPFYKAGMTDEQITNYWRAHWEHASWIQVVEMLRRGQLTEDQVRDWFRLVEIPPFWRDKLIAISYEVPTRVDVRRFWDMRTIDEARLREIYQWHGYHGKDLDDYVLWTKVYTAFPDLVARWTKGWITEDDVRSELIDLGMPADRVEEMIQTKIEPVSGERVAGERDLTKTDIIKGVKKEVISWSEGIELLIDMGYSEEEADYILTINITAASGSPESFIEFKDITQKYRKVAGMKAKPIGDDLRKAAAEVVRLTRDVAALKESVETEERTLVAGKILPPRATEKRDELRVSLHRAEAELSAAQVHYGNLLAQWRHAS